MSQLRSLLTNRVDPRNPQQFGRVVRLLWGLAVFGTLIGFLIQAAVGARVWSEVLGDWVPVLFGASIGYGLMWAASAVYGKRHRHADDANSPE